MNEQERAKIREFINFWKDKGSEKSDSHGFWYSLLRDVLGIEKPETLIEFEVPVKKGSTRFIDALIRSTHVLIEQKGSHVDLSKPELQSDGALLTPYEQAERYNNELTYNDKNKWIIVCNFQEFHVYDMCKSRDNLVVIPLAELETYAEHLKCIIDPAKDEVYQETTLSIQAGELIGKLYDALLAQYPDPDNPETLKSLNKLCVRLVFCLYAEDADIFQKDQFYEYLRNTAPEDIASELFDLFAVLNTPSDKRRSSLKPRLKAFPYVNGGLFQNEEIEIPQFTQDLKYILLHDCSHGFDWSGISPTIFGAVFESTLNPETRRAGGMHYTSIENIHKLIDVLFLNDLKKELQNILLLADPYVKRRRLHDFHIKLSKLVFFDPACGSGNFLTETYICLRKIENDIIRAVYGSDYRSISPDVTPIQVSISNFYGIEINDFAVAVAKTALWIAENQAIRNTEAIIHADIQFLPLKSYANIVEGNALRLDWETVVPKDKLNYILGNPPFVGGRWMSPEQKTDLVNVFGSDWKNVGNLDYVCAWYKKAVDLIKDTNIRVAFVSTNSICQGEQVPDLWKPLFEQGVHIDFAYRTFRWDSEAKIKAHVHCIIVGFSLAPYNKPKTIFEGEKYEIAQNINGYIVNANSVFVEKSSTPISNVSPIRLGGQAIDDGNFILTIEEKEQLLKIEPQCEPFLRLYMMGKDFINRTPRYCIWLVGADPSLLKKCPQILKRIDNVKKFRLSSKRESTLRAANTPTLFASIVESKGNYIAIPKVSSENRKYIPIDFLPPEIIPGDKLFVVEDADLYNFGVLTSSVHMAWMRAVCGRLKSDYSYSNTIVYNNFPWCTPTEEQKSKIEETAQAILDARAASPGCSLADLYDETTMTPQLRKAHQNNDRAVMKAYGFPPSLSEMDIVARLMEMYQELVSSDK